MILARIFSNFYTHKKKKKKEENLQKFKNANSTFREIRSKCLRLFSPFFLFLMAYKYFFWLFFLSFSDFFFSRESAKCHLDEKRKDIFTAVYSEAREVFFSFFPSFLFLTFVLIEFAAIFVNLCQCEELAKVTQMSKISFLRDNGF